MPTASPSTPYPLPQLLATAITSTHQNSLAKLEATLRTLTSAHTYCGTLGGPVTDCVTHGGPWRAAFKRLYIPSSSSSSQQPTWEDPLRKTWMGCRSPSYVQEIETMFDREDLATISERVDKERAQHIRESQNTTAAWEDRKVAKARSRAEELWIVGKDADGYMREMAQKYRNEMENDPRRKARNEEFEAAATREEQRAVLRKFACDPREDDTVADAALRVKWARHFDTNNMGYAEVEVAMKHDISLAQERVAELDTKLADLQSAYMAETRKREGEEEERRRVERENRRVCEGCGRELEVVQEGLCCGRCWGERRDGEGRLRGGWYCGEECARGDAERHNREVHGAS